MVMHFWLMHFFIGQVLYCTHSYKELVANLRSDDRFFLSLLQT